MANPPEPPLLDSLFTPAEWSELVAILKLTPRQAEVLHLLLSGQCDKQIALRLGITSPTVRTHLQRMYARFEVNDRTSLVVFIFRHFRSGQDTVMSSNQ